MITWIESSLLPFMVVMKYANAAENKNDGNVEDRNRDKPIAAAFRCYGCKRFGRQGFAG